MPKMFIIYYTLYYNNYFCTDLYLIAEHVHFFTSSKACVDKLRNAHTAEFKLGQGTLREIQ
jgi:hypothetical protein